MPGTYAKDLPSIIPQRSHRLVIEDPAKDALLLGDPEKTAFQATVADLLDGVKVILNEASSPLAVLPGQTVYVDTTGATGPLVATLPTVEPDSDTPIKFLPLGSYSATNLHIDPGVLNVANAAGEIVEVTTDNVAFEVRYISTAYGYGFFSLGNTYLAQSVTVNASDLVSIRYVAAGTIQLVPLDREAAVASEANVAGAIKLPLASDVTEGWQSTFFQLGDGAYTFALNDAAVGETLLALGGQYTSLGKGTFVTILLTKNNTWLIGGGLTGV